MMAQKLEVVPLSRAVSTLLRPRLAGIRANRSFATATATATSSQNRPVRISNRLTKTRRTQIRWQSDSPDKRLSGASQPDANTQLAVALRESDQGLVTTVNVQPDPDGIILPNHPALSLLGNSSIVIQRQIEMLNIFLNFEQANRYIIMDGNGETIGYIAEQDHGIGQAMMRQAARLHRSFTTHIFNKDQQEVLRIHRPFAYINSRIRIYDPIPEGGYEATTLLPSSNQDVPGGQVSPLKLEQMRIIGECQQVWSPTHRKYNLFTLRPQDAPEGVDETALVEAKTPDTAIESTMAQFAKIVEPMLSWNFTAKLDSGETVGTVNRNFRGLGREIFTDTGAYVLRMDAAAQEAETESAPGLTLDQRAVMIATAVSIDFDYFSRGSSMGAGYLPFMMMPGGAAAEGAATGAGMGAVIGGGEAAAGAGAIEGLGGAAAGTAARGVAGAGTVESGIAGAGTMAGYEAMQRGFGRGDSVDDASPQAAEQYPDTFGAASGQGENTPDQADTWGNDADPWSEAGDSAGDGESGGIIGTILSWFSDS